MRKSRWNEWKQKQKDFLVRYGIPDRESLSAQMPVKTWKKIAKYSVWGPPQFQRFREQLIKDEVVFFRGKTPYAYPKDVVNWTKNRLKHRESIGRLEKKG